MQKLHKLYLYAATQPQNIKKQTVTEYRASKQKSLLNLIKLLDHNKGETLPVVTLEQYANFDNIMKQFRKRNQRNSEKMLLNYQQKQKQRQKQVNANKNDDHHLHQIEDKNNSNSNNGNIPRNITKIVNVNTNKHDKSIQKQKNKNNSQTSTMNKSYLFLPKVSQISSIARRKQIKQEKQVKIQAKIQEYIEEYVRKLEEENLLDKYKDHSTLVKQAVRIIRQKMYLELKAQQNNQTKRKKNKMKSRMSAKAKINSLISCNSISKQGSNPSFKLLPQVIEKRLQSYEQIEEKAIIKKQRKKQRKYQLKYKSNDRNDHNDYHRKNSLKANSTRSFFIDSVHKKQQKLAQANLYKIDIQRIDKNMQIRDKQRRISQRNFVRKLSRNSFYAPY